MHSLSSGFPLAWSRPIRPEVLETDCQKLPTILLAYSAQKAGYLRKASQPFPVDHTYSMRNDRSRIKKSHLALAGEYMPRWSDRKMEGDQALHLS